MILLIFPNANPFPYHVMTPLSVFAVGSYLEKRGIEVEYYDERVQSREDLEGFLARKPELVGVSSVTSFQILRGLALTRLVKKRLPEVPVVWGGRPPQYVPGADFGRSGDRLRGDQGRGGDGI